MPNRLTHETSPYLLQHAGNPVDWYPWGEAAFEAARQEDKPVLLSIGYSACHWCHVMEKESFEDAETAGMMNEWFVNVKVDREERPDVDAIYMEAVQALTGHGGWPMTVWLTPEGRPFHAGTYFPKEDHHGMPSFRRVMAAVADAWEERRAGVLDQAERLTEAIGRTLPPDDTVPGTQAIRTAYERLVPAYDRDRGGLGGAPKFPQQPVLEFLLRIADEEWAPEAAWMVSHTLEAMARGGIYDHLGGGFARYSVDGRWLVPHFEKMLYDNAQLARIYLWSGQREDNPRFRRVARETLDYLMRDLAHAEGGFFSAEDADSEGVEGKFYVFTAAEFDEAAAGDAAVARVYFGVTEGGNFEGANILHEAKPIEEVAAQLDLEPSAVEAAVARAKEGLLAARTRRVRPGLDHKVVTSWNGLAIRALAEAGAVWREDRYVEAARRSAEFVLTHLRRPDGRLLRSWSLGTATIPAFLEDYGAYAVGLLALYRATGEPGWFAAAEQLVEDMIDLFAGEDGSFYSTGADADPLIKRPTDHMDNPLPSGSSLAAEALFLLSLYTGAGELRDRAEGLVRAGARLIEAFPSAVGHLLSVLYSMTAEGQEVAVVGPEAESLAQVVWERFRPGVALAVDPAGAGAERVPLLRERAREGKTLAYVCRQLSCLAPVESAADLRSQLAG